ncbi:MAG TPA: hypothetical protein VGF01_06555 [Terracidiphilus sp.]|jgi:hypothetical protein
MRRSVLLMLIGLMCIQHIHAQPALPQNPVEAIVELFNTHRIVMLGEVQHGCRQQWELLQELVAAPGFSEQVNDIVMEFGNARYQDVVDRYIAGEKVPIEQVEGAWLDTVGALGPVSPVYGRFYAAVRAVNKTLPKQRRLRIVLGDPPIDWNQVQTRADIALFLPFREEFYSSAVRLQVLAKKHKALLIMGAGHFRRSAGRPGYIENQLQMALVQPYVILPGSNMVAGYDDLDPRFDHLPAPSLIEMNESWIGSIPSQNPRGGQPSTLGQAADAYLYLGPRDKLTVIAYKRSDLEGTPYGKELERRLAIIFGKAPDFLPQPDDLAERPAFSRNATPPPPLPPMLKPQP